MPGNAEAVKVWAECRTQVIAGVGGVIDINILAVKVVMDMLEVKDQKRCMQKVRQMFAEYQDAMEEKRDAESKD